MELGRIIRKYREENGLSMDDLAQRCNLSKGYISMLEKGINYRTGKPIAPTTATIQKLAVAMRMDVNTLISELDENTPVIVNESSDYYYLNPETAQMAQELFDNPNMRILFDAARDCKPEDLQMAADMLNRFKKTNPDG